MLLELQCNCYVAYDQIAEIKVSEYGHITVRTKDGIGHHVPNDYGKGPYETVDRLVKKINSHGTSDE